MRQPWLEGLEDRITLTADVWTGGAAAMVQDLSWSNASNWSNGTPQSGQDLVFPSAGASTYIPTQAIVNDLANMTFRSIEIDAPGYSIAGDAISLTAPTGIFTTYSSGVSTFSINTNLAGGSVTVANNGELDINGDVSGISGSLFSGGGILGGNGQVHALTVQGSVVQPGILGVGGLSVQGGATFDPDSTFSASIDGPGVNSSLTAIGGPASPVVLQSPALAISIAPGYSPALGSTFTIIQGSVSGTFSGLPEGAAVSDGGGTTFRISYRQGVVLTAVEPTTVSLSVLNGTSSSVFGESLTFTAIVSDAGGTPTGSVTFEDGASVLGTATLDASGTATFTTAKLTIGQHAISALYAGNGNFAGSTSPVLDETVNQASTSTTVTSSANPSASGQNVTFTAQVRAVPPGGGTPTGTVSFFDGTSDLGDVALNGGVATYSTSTMALGSHPITAEYSGDNNFIAGNSNTVNQEVNQATTKTTVTSSANPSAFGQSVTFTAQVAAALPGTGTPTGSVTFFDGTTELGNNVLNAGVATFSTSDLTRGSHSITGVYSGDADFSASTSTVVDQNVNQANTTTILMLSPDASVLGQSVTFTAQVVAVAPGAGMPTGSVSFLDGTTELGIIALNSGSASFSTSALTLGSHSITAVYSGDGDDFLASTSSPSIELVGGTTVDLVSSINPSTFGQSVTFTATVAAAATGSGVPTGSVSFMDGTQVLDTSTIDASGVASFSTANLSGGTHAITAVYGGNTEFVTSTSSETDQVVNQASTSTSMLVSPSDGQSTFGQSVTLNAAVTGDAGTPTGSVTFKDGSTILGTSALDGSGIATFSSGALTVGAHSLVAVYSGSGSYVSSASSNLAITVAQATTTTILVGSTSTPVVGQLVTLTATIATVAPGAGAATGMVVFRDGSTMIGTAAVSAGQASITVAFSGVGKAHVIEASYLGSESFVPSGSANQTVTVVQPTSTTTLTATPLFVGSKARGVTFQVVVQAGSAGLPVPSGRVTLEINRRKFRTVVVTNGSASVFVRKRNATGKTFLVHYLGDANYKAGVSNRIHIRSRFFRPSLAAIRPLVPNE